MTRDEKIELYDKLVASHPGAERKGATIPYTSLNGHMYSQFTKADELALRLPADERIKFTGKYKTKLLEQYGIVQKEYVVIPDTLLKKTAELKPYFAMSFDHVNSLKPKPTTNAKKA